MFFLLNDLVLELEPSHMMHPLEAERFDALSLDYIAQLGKEMFAGDPVAHRKNPERARRLCYLIQLKLPRVNAAQFFATSNRGRVDDVDASFKSLNEAAMAMMYQEQMAGGLDAAKVDQAVWHRQAA